MSLDSDHRMVLEKLKLVKPLPKTRKVVVVDDLKILQES